MGYVKSGQNFLKKTPTEKRKKKKRDFSGSRLSLI